MKKSQTSDIFIYAFAIIVVGLILIFGAKKVIDIKNTGNEVELLNFKKHLETLISSSRGSGNVFNESLELPAGFSEVCFIDLELEQAKVTSLTKFMITHPIIYNSWESQVENNVFLVQNNKLKSFYIKKEQIKLSGNPVGNCEIDNAKPKAYICCKVNNGKVTLVFRGSGRSVLIGES